MPSFRRTPERGARRDHTVFEINSLIAERPDDDGRMVLVAFECKEMVVTEAAPGGASISGLLAEHYAMDGRLDPLPGEFDRNSLLTTGSGERFIVKLLEGLDSRNRLNWHVSAMNYLAERGFPVPRAIRNRGGDSLTEVVDETGRPCVLRLLSYLPGRFLASTRPADRGAGLAEDLGRFLGRIDRALAEWEYLAPDTIHKWDLAYGYTRCQSDKHRLDADQSALVDHFLEFYRQNVLPSLSELPRSFIHNDANDHNVLTDDQDTPGRITGLIDFGDMVYSHTVNELAIAAAYTLMGEADPIATLLELARGYDRERPLGDAELEALFGLVALRLCTTVCNGAAERDSRPANRYMQVSVAPALKLLGVLRDLNPFAVESRLRHACGRSPDKGRRKEDILAVRRRHLGRSLSISFSDPLKIVSGQGVWLYDERGEAYLDMVNNVCHVGHCHPKVVAAAAKQTARLNTNTRFLHDNLVDYAERLLATMPDELSVCMFVNSGSEANELAFRLARTFTGSRELLVVDGAYHGNTGACVEASPYKFDGPGGEGAPAHVHKVMLPDPYRGKYRASEPDLGARYAADVERAITELAAQHRRPGAFICESLQGVAGQIIMPAGYLQAAYGIVRRAGGVCIADEVQVGFGRVGSHMWAFETQAVVPDIVTLGKPIGNGHPMAAVITTPAIADAFATGMEYFNTFGGNPVSCAIGLAVLDVLRDECLQDNALLTGQYLIEELRKMQGHIVLIGEVRGLGLFIGVELVEDRDTKRPATSLTADLVEYLRHNNVILSTEGPFRNVLKIKPPIAFNRRDADHFLAALSAGFEALKL